MDELGSQGVRVSGMHKPVRSYMDLEVWQQSMLLVKQVYNLTRTLPDHEKYCHTSQIRRAAVSIPSNIAEGCGRRTTAAYIHHLNISNGSLKELETQIQLLVHLEYYQAQQIEQVWEQSASVGRLLNALTSALERKLADR